MPLLGSNNKMRLKNLVGIGVLFMFIIVCTVFTTAYANSFFNETSDATKYNLLSPSDSISESQILVYDNQVIIRIPNAQWASYLDTNSMNPVLNSDSNGIEIVPKSINEIHVGDIIAYETKWNNIPVVHRVVDIKEDELGTFFVLKGDNNEKPDPVKVRFDQIRYKLVAIIY